MADTATVAQTNQTLIPARLRSLGKLASTDASRTNLTGVRVEIRPDGTRFEATDGHQLTRVELRADAFPVADYPPIVGIPTEGGSAGTIPSKAWDESLRKLPKRPRLPVLGNGILGFNGQTATLASTDLDAPTTTTVNVLDGTFPNTDNVWPKTDATPEATVSLDFHLLKKVVDAWCAFGAEDRKFVVTVKVRGSSTPVEITATRETDGLTYRGLIMPCR